MSHKRAMESLDKIDAKWIKSRMTGARGETARMAEALGIKPDQASKIISGTRRLQPHEVPLVARFFGEEAVVISQTEKRFLELFRNAPDGRAQQVEALLAAAVQLSRTENP